MTISCRMPEVCTDNLAIMSFSGKIDECHYSTQCNSGHWSLIWPGQTMAKCRTADWLPVIFVHQQECRTRHSAYPGVRHDGTARCSFKLSNATFFLFDILCKHKISQMFLPTRAAGYWLDYVKWWPVIIIYIIVIYEFLVHLIQSEHRCQGACKGRSTPYCTFGTVGCCT